MSNLAGIEECCLLGHLHQGQPTGAVEKIAGLDTYVTGNNQAQTIIAITDIFGFGLQNVRLLADEYASAGQFRVLIPDFFQGDSVDVSHMKSLSPLPSDPERAQEDKDKGMGEAFKEVGPWLERHDDTVVQPLIHGMISALRENKAVLKIGVMGFCWGGRQALHLAGAGTETAVDAVLANHPSYAEFPATFEAINKPVLIQVGDADPLFPFEQVTEVRDKLFVHKKDCEVKIYPGATHGFTCRSDQNNAEEIKLKDESAKQGIMFFKRYLS